MHSSIITVSCFGLQLIGQVRIYFIAIFTINCALKYTELQTDVYTQRREPGFDHYRLRFGAEVAHGPL